MARQSASPIAHIRDLFTAAERKLLDSSFGSALAGATQSRIEAAARQARSLRDKWRDLSASQGRKTKRAGAASTRANARSHEKADAFHAAVERFERRLAELVSAVGATLGGKAKNPKAKARDKVIAGRAARRTAPRPEAPAPKRPAPAKAPVAAAPVAKVETVPAAPAASKKAAPPAPAPVASISRKARVNRAALVPQAAAQPIRLDGSKQRSARTAAKAKRIAIEGAKTRRSAHVVATGKRNQARRDGRKR